MFCEKNPDIFLDAMMFGPGNWILLKSCWLLVTGDLQSRLLKIWRNLKKHNLQRARRFFRHH